jgi:hypothetical protein
MVGLRLNSDGSQVGPRHSRFEHPIVWAALVALASCCSIAYGQSTFGTVLGSVRDPTGGVIPKTKVQLVNTGTNAVRETQSTGTGTYQFVNVDAGTYQLTFEAVGFQKTTVEPFELGARETKHIDMDLKVASGSITVTVEATSVVQSDVSNVAVTKGSLELNDLLVAIYTRSQGSTSAFSTLTAQPGVQTDGGNIMVAGATTSQLSVTVDGISSVGPASWGPLTELFPSFNAIEEIKISETLNPAEYVLPSGFTAVINPPPAINNIVPTFDSNGNPVAAIYGSGFQPDSRIFFDGQAGVIEGVQSDGSLLVTPPQASGGYTANVVALNDDGQSSSFIQPTPATYTYNQAGAPSLTVTPSTIPPTGSMTVDIVGANANFTGATTVGFGTSDASVQSITVLSPTHLSVVVSSSVRL